MTDCNHRTRPPLTSRVWFFPTLILLMPLVSRAFTSGPSHKPDKRAGLTEHEEYCLAQYNECVAPCPPDDGTIPDDGTQTPVQACVQLCFEDYEICLANPPVDDGPEGPTCEPDAGYCGYDEYDYGDYSSDDSSSDWSCDTSDDYSDDSGAWDCGADNYDEGDSGDWGQDWGEQSPAGGDGIEAPLDLPR